VERILTREHELIRQESVTMPLRPPQIPSGQAWASDKRP